MDEGKEEWGEGKKGMVEGGKQWVRGVGEGEKVWVRGRRSG